MTWEEFTEGGVCEDKVFKEYIILQGNTGSTFVLPYCLNGISIGELSKESVHILKLPNEFLR